MLASWLWLASLLSVVQSTAVTPMEKVRELLANLKKEIEEEAVVEAKNYAEFERWCDLEAQQTVNDIAGAKTRIEEHTASIDEQKAEITRLGYEMEKLAMQVSHKEEDLSKSTGLREKEHAEFVEVYETLQKSVDVLDKALTVLSKQVSKETLLQAQHALSFVLRQTNAASDAPNKMEAFFQQVAVGPQATSQTFLLQNTQPVQGAVYESHAGQVKSVIQQMKDDIVEQQKNCGTG
jgi:chromosome segregation ATPase